MTDEAGPSVARVALTALTLTDFRNYGHLAVALDGRSVVFVGANGSGKTNLLEAVSFLSPGRGLRRATYDAVARVGGSGGWTVHATVATNGDTVAIGTGLQPDPGGGPRSRRIRIDGDDAGTSDALLAHLDVLWLTPAMDGLFTGPAGDRRRFLDRLVMALDAGHGRRVSAYEKAVRHRNRLLEDFGADPAWLDAIEQEIARHGAEMAAARAGLVSRFAETIAALPSDASAFPRAELALDGPVEALAAELAPAALTEDFLRLLRDGRPRDRAAGRTLTGPHRTDLVVTHAEKAMPAAQASTGEQKALLIGLVLAHASLVARAGARAPVLLLDEIAAHLDPGRRAALFDRLDDLGGQTFMTGTDPILFEAVGDRAQTFSVRDGRLEL
ncbi:DNA replication/repair protein RecF [Amorphus coralli]|uniref:DNA replication/repair protein RecF n=1 Tax=Amorphus coralli TaxID=340680 RepID=UPI0003609694|nr:DNA replication/repair protein RecF [Amorphus coralli]